MNRKAPRPRSKRWGGKMCRNIRTLFNFEPAATDEEVRAASVQFVRKISGYRAPSKANEATFWAAVDEVTATSRALLDGLHDPHADERLGLEEREMRRNCYRKLTST